MTCAAAALATVGWLVWPLVLAVFAAVDAMFCGMETGIYVMNKIRLDLRAEGGSRPARLLRDMIRKPRNLLTVLLIGTNLCRYLATFSITSMFVMAGHGRWAEWYTLAIATPLLFVLSDSLPKGVFQRQGERLVYRFTWLLRGADLLFRVTGLSLLVRAVAAGLMRVSGAARRVGTPADDQHPGTILAEGYASGVMTHPQSVMADRVMHIAGITLADVMTELGRALTVGPDVTRDELLEQIRDHNFSRLPVIGPAGNVVGILSVYDVLAQPADGSATDGMAPPLVLPASLEVTAALYRMQRAKRAMAIVEDADGAHVGLVTIKDLVEEIIGEIQEW